MIIKAWNYTRSVFQKQPEKHICGILEEMIQKSGYGVYEQQHTFILSEDMWYELEMYLTGHIYGTKLEVGKGCKYMNVLLTKKRWLPHKTIYLVATHLLDKEN